MKPNHYQSAVLQRIERGDVQVTGPQCSQPRHRVASFQWSRDGFSVVAHRTILTNETGNPRLDYRVEMFRIPRDGVVQKL